jgi:hypothetical protein
MRTKKSITKKSITKKASTINILSYNISWESTSGNVKKWALCNNNTDINNSKHYSVCVNNISNVFDHDINHDNHLDFITLQEATDYKKLIKESSKLKTMKYEIHNSGLDVLVTFWNNSMYKLKYKILGEFEEGRPWMATIFKNKKQTSNTSNTSNTRNLCLVNVHMGHYSKEEEFHMMNNMMIEIKKGIETKETKKKKEKKEKKENQIKTTMRYIISGDFNYDIKEFGDARNSFKLNNTKFYFNPKHILTCCINRNRHNDHVIDSLKSPNNISIPKVDYMASDHKPILVNC